MGADRDLELAIDLYDQLGITPTGFAPNLNTIWDTDVLDLDPTGLDVSTEFETPGIDIEFGGDDPGVINLETLTGVPAATPPSWTTWRLANGGPIADEGTYVGVRSTEWSDWEERQWFLLNLFRTLHTDDLVPLPPGDRALGTIATDEFDPSTIEVLRIVE